MIQKPPMIALILALVGVVILCTLGMWQVKRLAWKTGLQAELDQAYELSETLPSLSTHDVIDQDFVFKRGLITGRYIANQSFLIMPRTHDGDVGKHLYGAFRINDGGVVFVNRGWVPQDFSLPKDGEISNAPQTLTGIFKAPPRANAFTPDNDLETEQWYHPDLIAMKDQLDSPEKHVVINALFILEEDQSSAPYPLKEAIKIELRNQHQQYAVFWFMMAGILVGVFFMRFMRVKPNG